MQLGKGQKVAFVVTGLIAAGTLTGFVIHKVVNSGETEEDVSTTKYLSDHEDAAVSVLKEKFTPILNMQDIEVDGNEQLFLEFVEIVENEPGKIVDSDAQLGQLKERAIAIKDLLADSKQNGNSSSNLKVENSGQIVPSSQPQSKPPLPETPVDSPPISVNNSRDDKIEVVNTTVEVNGATEINNVVNEKQASTISRNVQVQSNQPTVVYATNNMQAENDSIMTKNEPEPGKNEDAEPNNQKTELKGSLKNSPLKKYKGAKVNEQKESEDDSRLKMGKASNVKGKRPSLLRPKKSLASKKAQKESESKATDGLEEISIKDVLKLRRESREQRLSKQQDVPEQAPEENEEEELIEFDFSFLNKQFKDSQSDEDDEVEDNEEGETEESANSEESKNVDGSNSDSSEINDNEDGSEEDNLDDLIINLFKHGNEDSKKTSEEDANTAQSNN